MWHVTGLDEQVMKAARERWDRLTKPLGALGQVEEIGIRLAGIQGTVFPSTLRKAVVVMCGDHGVVAEGVSAFPQAVTGLMMHNFTRGGAAINVLARQMGAQVHVVDVGSCVEEELQGVHLRKVRRGTANMAQGPAMTREEAMQAIEVGREKAAQLQADGVQVVALGEMGIGNTTPSAAVTAVLTGRSLEQLVGRGTGIKEEAVRHKLAVIAQAIAVNHPQAADPLDVLTKVGGLEIAGLVGVVLGAAQRRLAVVVDGVIAGAAALVAQRMVPGAGAYLFASHLSQEPAHAVILQELGLQPLLHLDMRLGEGTGAVLTFPLLDAATRLVREMATFADLGL
ncbi:MAG TPA: nicotinate-nucleotide--dimethylbenzimidazole phosphoribosyltransferase [Bacilli bacterium]|nr:nicotinate-nucleotide--dimethylbenzimidazole phosphoribosyltransferase [Bacilli bacterium]